MLHECYLQEVLLGLAQQTFQRAILFLCNFKEAPAHVALALKLLCNLHNSIVSLIESAHYLGCGFFGPYAAVPHECKVRVYDSAQSKH